MLSVYLGGKPGGGQCSCVVGGQHHDYSSTERGLEYTVVWSSPHIPASWVYFKNSYIQTKQNKTAKKFAEPKIESTQKGDPLYLLTQQWMMPILF